MPTQAASVRASFVPAASPMAGALRTCSGVTSMPGTRAHDLLDATLRADAPNLPIALVIDERSPPASRHCEARSPSCASARSVQVDIGMLARDRPAPPGVDLAIDPLVSAANQHL